MASFRQRPTGTWEFMVKCSGVLPKPKYFTFDTKEEGIQFCRDYEKGLRAGKILPEPEPGAAINTVGLAVSLYLEKVAVPESDKLILSAVGREFRDERLAGITFEWLDAWITRMKQVDKLAPGTIKKRVGSLSRCFDYILARESTPLKANPAKKLHKGYASYTDKDAKVAGVRRVDASRNRRLEDGEEDAIREAAAKRDDGEALKLMMTLALETAMRMRETYTLTWAQVDLKARTIFLDKTKNGSSRQVPLTTVAVAALKAARGEGRGQVFHWWDGDTSEKALRDTTQALSRIWSAVFDAAKCPDFHYHDFRHEATSRLYERTQLSDLQIAKITGHKTLSMLARYANLRGSDLANRLW